MPAGSVDGVLAGRYRLDELIAVGGMGEVWRGHDTVLGRTVAVKCLKPEYVHDPEFSERFRAEARHAAGLSHPGIASVYDYGEQAAPEKAAWLVMELVDGEPLSALLHREGRLPPERTLDVVGQAALALEAAHIAGVVHRDVKPGNLLVRPDGVVKVTDFGIARATDAVPITRSGSVVGTAYYLSPEQASGGPVTPASDVYSLGVVAYECLAGRRPFVGDNPVAVASAHMSEQPPPLSADIPAPVRALVSGAMEKDPSRRPAHAGELGRTALELRDVLRDGGDATTVLPLVTRAAAADPPTRALTTLVPPAAVPPPTLVPPTTLAPPPTLVPPTTAPPRPPRRLPPVPPPPHRQHRRAVRLASVLLGVVALGLSLRACDGGASPTGPTVAATATASPRATATAKVTVRSADYAGERPLAVREALTRLGLRPTYAYDGKDAAAGTVSSVTPTGPLTVGSPVTVHVVPVPERGEDKGRDKDKGEGEKDD